MATTKAGEAATLDMGPGTMAIPLSLFRDNRLRVRAALKAIPNVGDDDAFVLLQGGDAINLYNTDVEYNFRQVSKVYSNPVQQIVELKNCDFHCYIHTIWSNTFSSSHSISFNYCCCHLKSDETLKIIRIFTLRLIPRFNELMRSTGVAIACNLFLLRNTPGQS